MTAAAAPKNNPSNTATATHSPISRLSLFTLILSEIQPHVGRSGPGQPARPADGRAAGPARGSTSRPLCQRVIQQGDRIRSSSKGYHPMADRNTIRPKARRGRRVSELPTMTESADGWYGFLLRGIGWVEVAMAKVDGLPEIVGLRMDVRPMWATEDELHLLDT